MASIVLSEFKGLNEKRRDAANGTLLPAKECIDVDLSRGTIRPFKTNTLVENGHANEIVKFDGEWFSGFKNYVIRNINGFQMLIYKAGETWKRIVRKPRGANLDFSNQEIDLGISTPDAPTVIPLENSLVRSIRASEAFPFKIGYAITWVIDVEGYREESGPSVLTYQTNTVIGFRIKRNGVVPDNAVGWKIYRISEGRDATTNLDLVVYFDNLSDSSYDDYLLNEDLLGGFPLYYTTTGGAKVFRAPPDVIFDGMCRTSFHGREVAWKDSDVLIGEPNVPGSFPSAFILRAPAKVLACEVYGGDLYLFTEMGVQRCLGSDPITMMIVPDYMGDGIVTREALCVAEDGIYFMTRKGMGRVNSSGYILVSRAVLSEDFFAGLNMDSIFMTYGNGMVYAFHDKGTLIFNQNDGVGFVKHRGIYKSAFFDRRTATMYVNRNGTIQGLFEGDEFVEMTYKLGELVLNVPDDKFFSHFILTGSGEIRAGLYLDEEFQYVDDVDLSGGVYDRTFQAPASELARSAQLEISGKGELKEIKAHLFVGE